MNWCICVCVLEERQLDLDEKPLVVQLNWNKDDREGRFVLKNENDILPKVGCSVCRCLLTRLTLNQSADSSIQPSITCDRKQP